MKTVRAVDVLQKLFPVEAVDDRRVVVGPIDEPGGLIVGENVARGLRDLATFERTEGDGHGMLPEGAFALYRGVSVRESKWLPADSVMLEPPPQRLALVLPVSDDAWGKSITDNPAQPDESDDE